MSRISTVGRSLQVGKEQKGLIELVLLGQIEDGTVQTDKDGNLRQRWEASGQRVDIVGLVDFGNLLVHDLWVALVLGLEFLHLRLDGLMYKTNV